MFSPKKTEPSKFLRVWRRGLMGLIGLAVLLGVLSMYVQPVFLLTVANQVWGCF